MQQNVKQFAERLNKALDELDAPIHMRERSVIFGKMLHISKQQAWSLLEGHVFPDEELLETILSELEVDRDWLLGNKE